MDSRKNTGTFLVKVLRTEHSSWQGSVTWVDERKTQNFKSTLELVKIMDEILKGQSNCES